jgi:mRNA interferase HigB
MHIITKRALKAFYIQHPDAKNHLLRWFRILSKTDFANISELRSSFSNSVDSVGNKTVFNIGGNKYRLIASIHFNRKKVYIRRILTHVEYDKGDWKQ